MTDPLDLIKALLALPSTPDGGWCEVCADDPTRQHVLPHHPSCPRAEAVAWVTAEEARREAEIAALRDSLSRPTFCAVCGEGFSFPNAMGVRLLDGRHVHPGRCASVEWLRGVPGATPPTFRTPTE